MLRMKHYLKDISKQFPLPMRARGSPRQLQCLMEDIVLALVNQMQDPVSTVSHA